ncbi:MAG: hypothetical protein K2L46_08880, partial [Paramuribaculum sp.]|nr:hypothetical protein [Paramuribaculum sp.]
MIPTFKGVIFDRIQLICIFAKSLNNRDFAMSIGNFFKKLLAPDPLETDHGDNACLLERSPSPR